MIHDFNMCEMLGKYFVYISCPLQLIRGREATPTPQLTIPNASALTGGSPCRRPDTIPATRESPTVIEQQNKDKPIATQKENRSIKSSR